MKNKTIKQKVKDSYIKGYRDGIIQAGGMVVSEYDELRGRYTNGMLIPETLSELVDSKRLIHLHTDGEVISIKYHE